MSYLYGSPNYLQFAISSFVFHHRIAPSIRRYWQNVQSKGHYTYRDPFARVWCTRLCSHANQRLKTLVTIHKTLVTIHKL